MADKQSINLLIMKKIQLILLLTLSLFLLDCNPVEYTEYYPTEIITYSFQNSSSTDVIFRIYSSKSNATKEDGFFVLRSNEHKVYSFDSTNPFYLLPDATENYTTISNGKVYVVQRPGDAGSVYDDAFWEEAHYQFVVTDKLFENGTPL